MNTTLDTGSLPRADLGRLNAMNTKTASPLKNGAWTLDPAHSSVGFTVRHLGISKVRGAFRSFDASLTVDGDEIAVTASIETASIDTGNRDRDAHVLSADLLDAVKRPRLEFRSTRVERDGETGTLTGDLTIGDVTRPVTLDVEFGGLVEFPGLPGRHGGFDATGELRRSDFGLSFGAADAILSDRIKLQLDIQFVEPGDD
ncbi:YceI family protein [Actinomadura atramentaria]|uniref:YceI family protein n=1 Tax=Actinomadura atramentaria TaxID=1990 RepID=UPI0003A69636|nr:YceI family protein [Actinomadura atramentaria]